MRIKIGKSRIRGADLAEGLGVAGAVGAGAAFIPDPPSPGQFIPDPEPRSTARMMPRGMMPRGMMPSTANPLDDPNFGSNLVAKNPLDDPDFGKPRSTAQPDTGQFIPDPAPSTAKP